MSGDIRCASYDLYLVDQSQRRRADCDFSDQPVDGKWRRTLNRTSTTELEINTLQIAGCCGCQPNRYQDRLVIDRTSDITGDTDTVWSGPVTRHSQTARRFALEADDDSLRWQIDTRTKNDFTTSGDQTDVWMAIRRAQNSRLRFTPEPTNQVTDVELAAGDSWSLAVSELDQVRWSVIDRTVHGPKPYGGASKGRLVVSKDFSDSDQVGPQVVGEGFYDHVNVWFSTGDRLDCVTVPAAGGDWPLNLDVNTVTGPRARLLAERVAESAWRRQATANQSLFLVTGETSLSELSGVCVADLVPGTIWDVDTDQGCGGASQQMELVNVVVDFARIVEGGRSRIRETRVAVDLVAPGTEITSADLVSL